MNEHLFIEVKMIRSAQICPDKLELATNGLICCFFLFYLHAQLELSRSIEDRHERV